MTDELRELLEECRAYFADKVDGEFTGEGLHGNKESDLYNSISFALYGPGPWK